MTSFFGLVHDPAGGFFDPVIFSVHFVFAQIFHFDRPESAQAGMEGGFGETNAFDLKAFDQFFTEMKPRGRSSYGAFMLGIYGLVAFFVFGFGLALDVFRQGGFSQCLQHHAKLLVGTIPEETDRTSAAGGIVDHFGHQFVAFTEIELIAYADLPGRIHDHIPKAVSLVQFAKQEYLDLGAGFFLTAVHTGWKYLRVVHHKHVLVIKIINDVFEMTVLDLAGLSVDDHHPAVFSFFGGLLGDQVKREVEAEL